MGRPNETQWEQRLRELKQTRERQRAKHLAKLLRDTQSYFEQVGFAVRVKDATLLVDGDPFNLLSDERFRADAGPIIDRLVANRFLNALESTSCSRRSRDSNSL